MTTYPIHSIVLAAGKGTRMHSLKPKALQTLAGKTLLEHVLIQARLLSEHTHVVYGFAGDLVRQSVNDSSINWVEQTQQLGTGHAALQAMPDISDDSISLILYADVPLIRTDTLKALINQAQKNHVALLSVLLDEPTGYGRIIRDNQQIQAIVEQKDASAQQQTICEVNTGIMAVHSGLLKTYLRNLDSSNAQGEFYLTDIIAMAVADGKTVDSVVAKDELEVTGVNDKQQLAKLERAFQQAQAAEFMQQGLGLKDPSRFDCRGTLGFGTDCEIDINVLIEGDVVLGDNTIIAPNCILKNVKVGSNVSILSNSVIEDALIGDQTSIGPFARIRPQTKIGENAKIGNFVEVKKSTIGKYSKISHLSYVGDTTLGTKVNVGAGVITCNYDGADKHQTVIGDGAFIGSGSQLIAPVSIGKNAMIGAGSTITKDAPEDVLTISRAKQTSLKNWRKSSKK